MYCRFMLTRNSSANGVFKLKIVLIDVVFVEDENVA